ncbi:MAG: thiol-disulfide oxidoreductase DCC family protein [Micrococcales bacterium]
MSANPVLIYDGECGFCKQSLAWGQRNLTAFPAAIPSQDARAKVLGLSQAELDSQVWLVGGGLRLGGARAVAYMLRRQPQIWWQALGILAVIFLPISNLLYRWVAKNRGRFGTKSCAVSK